MILNLSMILRNLLFLILIFFSLVFFLSGYNKLKNIEIVDNIYDDKKEKDNLEEKVIDYKNNNLSSNQFFVNQKDSSLPKIEKDEILKEITLIVKENDTFSYLIDPYIPNNKTKQKIIKLINKEFKLNKLNIGQRIFLYISDKNNKKEILKIAIPLNFNTNLVFEKNNENNTYSANKVTIPITIELVSQKYSISNSIYKDGNIAKIPLVILSEIIRLYSFDVDFQRDIKKGNELEIMYQIMHNNIRKTISYGNIEYVNLILKKSNIEYFLYKSSDESYDYFNAEGKNARKTLMKTPLDGAKISSNFGMRKHPILGYNKKHQGVDFAAPHGTPIYAAGNGTIEYAGNNGGYGRYIRIRHNSSYKTAYAHLSKFNKGITKGARVKQGQTIGYVGSTGRSTGAHLHYEVIFQKKLINPMTMKMPSGKILKLKELENFKVKSKKIYSDFLFNLYE